MSDLRKQAEQIAKLSPSNRKALVAAIGAFGRGVRDAERQRQKTLVEKWRRAAQFAYNTADGCVHAVADRTVADVLRQGADVHIACADELAKAMVAER